MLKLVSNPALSSRLSSVKHLLFSKEALRLVERPLFKVVLVEFAFSVENLGEI
jgi:hypothetical protein